MTKSASKEEKALPKENNLFNDFEKAVKANNWTEEHRVKITSGYLREVVVEWYKRIKVDIEFWRVKEKKLYELQQKDTEKVDLYATKFQKLLNRVNTDNGFSNGFIVQMFLKGLKGNNAELINISAPKNLGDAIAAVKQIEAENYSRINSKLYNSISKNEGYKSSSTMEPGHLVRNCISEKKNYIYIRQNKGKEYDNKPKNISFCELKDDRKEEVFIANNISSEKEKRLRKMVRIYQEQLEKNPNMEIENPFIEKPLLQEKPKKKRGPSKIDSLTPYNVADDILSLPTSVKVEQILQYPNQRKNLVKILKRLSISKEAKFLKEYYPKIPISNNSTENLEPYREDEYSDSRDTFD
ncbi:31237_t:CDS:2 [Gigaspora margarita]|uniref:31237_t:CDS:1 n=1 Tax=Gigaspora margarita TaxID=4874 RepID=A0ABN7U7L5_GIGMA|nr:31237_t:CDS:2 [Gigaspora margarita]